VRDAQGKRINCRKKHGSWSYVHELPPAADGRRRQTTKGGFATEREAQNALTESLDKVNRVGYVEPARLKVGEYLDQWLAGKAGLRSSTRRSYREHIDLYLRPGLGYIRLTDLLDAGADGDLPDAATTDRLYPLYHLYHLIAYRGLRRGRGDRRPMAGRRPGRREPAHHAAGDLIGREIEVGKPKTEGGEAHRLAGPRNRAGAARWRERQDTERATARRRMAVTRDLCFTREDGNQLPRST
jgi:hypothetical protein